MKRLKTEEIYFLTTNPQKTKDFQAMGFSVLKNSNEPTEILSPHSSEVALYKSKDTAIKNAVVEDTALTVEDAPFLGTQIKDYWEIISNDERFHGKKAIWEISVCLSTDTHFIVSTGRTEGKIKFPRLEDAYHFDQVFSLKDKTGAYEYFHLLSPDEKEAASPRNKAVLQLKEAILNNDFSKLQVFEKENVPEWKGSYQSSEIVQKIAKGVGPKIR